MIMHAVYSDKLLDMLSESGLKGQYLRSVPKVHSPEVYDQSLLLTLQQVFAFLPVLCPELNEIRSG